MEFRIEPLGRHADYIPVLAQWQFQQWGHLTPGESVDHRITRLRQHVGHHEVMPRTFVAVSDGRLLGSASLVLHDMKTRKDLSPWLAGVYVARPFRRQGVASALVNHVVVEAARANVARLYLFTPDQERLYARVGWQPLEHVEYRGEQVVIMHRWTTE